MKAVILNSGVGAAMFETLARRLASVMQAAVVTEPAECNYVLGWDGGELSGRSFIPFPAIRAASDKRILARLFAENDVATPPTHLLDTEAEVDSLLRRETRSRWVLKWPTGCGASGHRLQEPEMPIPAHWPRPFVLQRFVPMERPEVYRLYCVGGETFGWNARRFPAGAPASPFVAHARGARYERGGNVPPEAEEQARRALACTDLIGSFGCVDLLPNPTGGWLVLEVNTDGLFSYVDRDIAIPGLAQEIDERIAEAFRWWVRQKSDPASQAGRAAVDKYNPRNG